MRAVGFFKLRLGSEDLKRTDKDASRGTVSLLRLSRQIRNYIWSVIKKLFLFLNQWIFLLRQIKDDLVCGSFPDVFVLESRLYSCCSFSASLNFAFCVSAITAACVCVWSVDTQIWKLHLVHGDGLVLSVTRWDGNHSGRAGWRPAGGGRWRSSLTFVFRWLLKKKTCSQKKNNDSPDC